MYCEIWKSLHIHYSSFQYTGAIEWDLYALEQGGKFDFEQQGHLGGRVWAPFMPMDDGLKKNMVEIVADSRTNLNSIFNS